MDTAPSDREAGINGPSDEECERCVVCLARADASSGGLICDHCRDEFYCGVQHRNEHRDVHQKVCFRPTGLRVVEGKPVCSVCGVKGLLCARCGQAAYCSREHQMEDWPHHKKSCKKPSVDKINPKDDDDKALGLPALPKELLLTLCALLGPYDLVRLGQVNRVLRVVARDPAAWQHVTFPERKPSADAAVERGGRSMMGMLDREAAIKRCCSCLGSTTWPCCTSSTAWGCGSCAWATPWSGRTTQTARSGACPICSWAPTSLGRCCWSCCAPARTLSPFSRSSLA